MKKINECIITIILIAFLITPVYGFAGMGGGTNASNNTNARPDPGNTTSSDLDIRLLQHLIEIDSTQLSSENKLLIRETLIFKNIGAVNFSGPLRTWVPDGIEAIRLERRGMMEGTLEYPLQPVQAGNIIEWQDIIIAGSVPPLYSIEYVVYSEPKGQITKIQNFTKKLLVTTKINYKYEGKPGLPSLVLKVTKPQGSQIELLDENGNKITYDDNSEEGTVYRFGNPQFREIEIRISSSPVSSSQASTSQIAGYVIIGLLILLVISYPILRKKSEKIRGIEEKLRSSSEKQKESQKEDIEEEVEESSVKEDAVLSGMTKNELENKKNKLVSKLEKLKKDYAEGNLLDEEYDELRRPSQKELKKINRILEKIE